ncbi:unnamed protein product, partial [Phaeothamnion confervicola]
ATTAAANVTKLAGIVVPLIRVAGSPSCPCFGRCSHEPSIIFTLLAGVCFACGLRPQSEPRVQLKTISVPHFPILAVSAMAFLEVAGAAATAAADSSLQQRRQGGGCKEQQHAFCFVFWEEGLQFYC